MTYESLHDCRKALLGGLLIALMFSTLTVASIQTGATPFPENPSRAFIGVLLGKQTTLRAGFLLQLLYLTCCIALFLGITKRPPTFLETAAFSTMLLAVLLFVLYPIIGWGMAGMQLGWKAPVFSAAIHLLLVMIIWIYFQLFSS